MNYHMIFYILGWILNIISILMLLPFSVSLYYGESNGKYFLICATILALVGILFTRKKPKNQQFFAKDGFAITALSWILLSIVGCLPFWLSGEIPSFTNALFECISGFTTTGASILHDVEALSRCMMFWRCFIQWIGGMGVLVFLLALIPLTGGANLFLMKAESPGPNVSKLVPKLQKTAYYLYAIYFVLTILQIICLVIAKMPLFDAVCTAFTTASTGGFATKNASLGAFSPTLQYITGIFLFLFGFNYNFFFFLWIRKWKDALRMQEIKLYVLIFFASTAAIAADIAHAGYTVSDSIRHAFVQVGSIMTTAGFASTDFDLWPSFSKGILVLLMFVGGCAGSTCGGIKVERILIYLKTVKKEFAHLCHPRNIKVIQVDGKPVAHDVLRSANIFLISYIGIFIGSVLIVSLDGYDMVTNFTAVASALGNIGPGLSLVGPTCNFDGLSMLSKYVCMFDMLAGRLELFPLLILLYPSTWKRR